MKCSCGYDNEDNGKFCGECGNHLHVIKRKSPRLTAILNFLIPGLGYIYAGTKRKYFRIGLTIGSILALASPQGWNSGIDAPLIAAGFIIALVFAVDGYQDVKQRNRSVEDKY